MQETCRRPLQAVVYGRETGVERLPQATIEAALSTGTIKKSGFERIIADASVREALDRPPQRLRRNCR